MRCPADGQHCADALLSRRPASAVFCKLKATGKCAECSTVSGPLPAVLQPPTLASLDIDAALVEHLLLRRALIVDQTSIAAAAATLALDTQIVMRAFETLRSKKFVEVLGLNGDDYRFQLTELGRSRAIDSTARCAYAGIAPVSLETYTAVVAAFSAEVRVNGADVRRVMSDLVLPEDLLDSLGPAFSQQRSVFLYGPAGTGKTSIAERFSLLYGDVVVVPHAIEVDNQIITVFDPTLHKPVSNQPAGVDPRWMVCERPFVITGGELELSMLQIRRDPLSGIYNAPLQMKANNGVLLIDDFGRQLIQPGALLNRWIVPLERRIDFLSLEHGTKFAIPFEVLVVFSTNFPPRELGDQAFFRRIPNKIYVGDVTPDEFDEISARALAATGLSQTEGIINSIRLICFAHIGGELRGCYPWDIAKISRNIVRYEGLPMELTRAVAERAARMYFANEDPRDGMTSRTNDLMGSGAATNMGVAAGMGAANVQTSSSAELDRELRALSISYRS
jgi:hypothetical protein